MVKRRLPSDSFEQVSEERWKCSRCRIVMKKPEADTGIGSISAIRDMTRFCLNWQLKLHQILMMVTYRRRLNLSMNINSVGIPAIEDAFGLATAATSPIIEEDQAINWTSPDSTHNQALDIPLGQSTEFSILSSGNGSCAGIEISSCTLPSDSKLFFHFIRTLICIGI